MCYFVMIPQAQPPIYMATPPWLAISILGIYTQCKFIYLQRSIHEVSISIFNNSYWRNILHGAKKRERYRDNLYT